MFIHSFPVQCVFANFFQSFCVQEMCRCEVAFSLTSLQWYSTQVWYPTTGGLNVIPLKRLHAHRCTAEASQWKRGRVWDNICREEILSDLVSWPPNKKGMVIGQGKWERNIPQLLCVAKPTFTVKTSCAKPVCLFFAMPNRLSKCVQHVQVLQVHNLGVSQTLLGLSSCSPWTLQL